MRFSLRSAQTQLLFNYNHTAGTQAADAESQSPFLRPAPQTRVPGAKPLRTERNFGSKKFNLSASIAELPSIKELRTSVVLMAQEETINKLLELKSELLDGWLAQESVPASTLKIFQNMKILKMFGKESEESVWNKRLLHTQYLIDSMIRYCRENLVETFGYIIDGKLVGCLVIDKQFIKNGHPPYIAGCVTHPGSSGVGSVLLEQAVNASEQWGCKGKVQMIPANSVASQISRHAGFRKPNPLLLFRVLDPSASDDWGQVNGRWLIRKYAGQPLFEGVDQSYTLLPSESETSARFDPNLSRLARG